MVVAAIVPVTLPFDPLLLTKTENPVLVVSEATVASLVISDRMFWNSVFSVARLAAVVLPDAAWVDRVASRSSRVEMLLSAPSLIWSVDRPPLAFRIPWFTMEMSLR